MDRAAVRGSDAPGLEELGVILTPWLGCQITLEISVLWGPLRPRRRVAWGCHFADGEN